MELIEEFDTTQCHITVHDTGWCVDYYHIYVLKSYHKKSGKILTKFGTKDQIDGMIRTYKGERKFVL